MLTMNEFNDELQFTMSLNIARFDYRLLQYVKKSYYYKNNINEFLQANENSRRKDLALAY